MITAAVLLSLVAAAWAVALCLSRVRRLHRLHIRVDAARAGLDVALARREAAAAAAGVTVPGAAPVPRAAADPGVAAPASRPARVPDSAVDAEAAALVSRRPRTSTSEAQSAADGDAVARDSGCPSVTTPVPGSAADVDAVARDSGCPSVTTPVPGSAADAEAAANALGRALAGLDRAALPADVRAELVEAEQLLVLARRVYNDAVRDTLGLRSRRLVRWLRLAGTAPMPAYFEIADPPPALTYDRVSPTQE